jgi:uncharacterized RDD family membrane protein YckC
LTSTNKYCEKCGNELDPDSVFCSRCGAPIFDTGIINLATWGERAIAIILDGIILGILLSIFRLPGYYIHSSVPISLGVNNILEFLYFIFMDFYWGQTIGKMIIKIRVTKIGGTPLTLIDAAIESFGKVFLLPIDFVIGFIFYKEKNQRLFNYLSDTVVIQDSR